MLRGLVSKWKILKRDQTNKESTPVEVFSKGRIIYSLKEIEEAYAEMINKQAQLCND